MCCHPPSFVNVIPLYLKKSALSSSDVFASFFIENTTLISNDPHNAKKLLSLITTPPYPPHLRKNTMKAPPPNSASWSIFKTFNKSNILKILSSLKYYNHFIHSLSSKFLNEMKHALLPLCTKITNTSVTGLHTRFLKSGQVTPFKKKKKNINQSDLNNYSPSFSKKA